MVPPPPPPLSDELPCWWDEVWASPVDVRRRIFCNRSLNMEHIKVIRSYKLCRCMRVHCMLLTTRFRTSKMPEQLHALLNGETNAASRS